jgi:dipeptidyl aminopeptidase/acylaminoacyl peptidase
MDEQLTANGLAPMDGTEHSGADSPESLLLGAKITEIPDRVRAANPATYIRENAPSFLIQHGVNDLVVPVQQSMELAAKLREVCGEGRVILDLIEGAEHGDPKFEISENVKKVLGFLDQQLKQEH